jgi:hypothetical protein
MPDPTVIPSNVDWKSMADKLKKTAEDAGVPVTRSGGTIFSDEARPFRKLSLSERHAADAGIAYDPRCAPPKSPRTT